MEQKQRENEEYIARKSAEIAELEKEHEKLKPRLQELQLITEEKKTQDLKSEITDIKKMIISYQKNAEERIAALEEQMQVKYVDIGKSLNERMDSFQTVMEQTALLTTNDVKARISNVQDNVDTKLTNISTKFETLERTLMNKLEWMVDGRILVLGGDESNKMHLLNRERTQWSTLSLKLPTSLYRGGAIYLDEEIYIFGGQNSEKKTYKLSREMKWIQLADMNEERMDISNSSVAFDGCIWVFGGMDSSEEDLNSVEKYIPKENKWIQMPPMNEKRWDAAAAACKGKLFVSGGYNGVMKLRSMECFDPASQKWTIFLDLPSATCGHAMISDGICLTVLGGAGENKSVWKINTNEENASWKVLPQMRESRRFFTANLLGDNIFAIGGVGHNRTSYAISRMECFDPASQKWTMFLDLPSATYEHAMISDGICLTVLGGKGENKSVWQINPNEEKATWKKLPPMRESRYQHTANLLGDNIFAIGGAGSKKVEVFNGETWEYGPELPEELKNKCSIVIPTHLAAALFSH